VIFLGCIAGVVALRFWLFPPESLADRARVGVVAASLATTLVCFALTAHSMRTGADAIARAREHARKEQATRDTAIRKILDEQREDLGARRLRP
jgi:hypothetical protein